MLQVDGYRVQLLYVLNPKPCKSAVGFGHRSWAERCPGDCGLVISVFLWFMFCGFRVYGLGLVVRWTDKHRLEGFARALDCCKMLPCCARIVSRLHFHGKP